MRKITTLLVLSFLVLTSCSKKDDPSFDYDLDILLGTWRIVQVGDIDITVYPYSLAFSPTYATFNSNGTYYGSGYFGDGEGTYTAIGKTITTYVEGQKFLTYEIISLKDDVCELNMSDNSSSTYIKCKKIITNRY